MANEISILFNSQELEQVIQGLDLLHKQWAKGFKPAIPDDNELLELSDLRDRIISIREEYGL